MASGIVPASIQPASRPRLASRAPLLLALLALLALYLPLATNPGWFSHDELQWNARATGGGGAPAWVGWWDPAVFQWRPLTFNLWLLLAWICDARAELLHPLWLALGGGVALLLRSCLRALRLGPGIATGAALAFAASPFAVFVHGWVATLADLLWVGLGLIGARMVLALDPQRVGVPLALALATTAAALLAKEAALALAPLAALAWWLSGFERRWMAATIGAALPALLYLLLRLPVLAQHDGGDSAYAWGLASVPARWIEMLLWTFLPTVPEPLPWSALPGRRALLAALVVLALLACAFRASWRTGAGLLLGGAVALGPALALGFSSPQYGYGHAAVACAALALAWPRLDRPGHAVLMFALLVSSWHAWNVQRGMRRAGEIEARFTPTLQQARAGALQVALLPEREGDAWLYRRLAMPLTDGEPAGVVVSDPAHATHRVRADGTVEVLVAPDTP